MYDTSYNITIEYGNGNGENGNIPVGILREWKQDTKLRIGTREYRLHEKGRQSVIGMSKTIFSHL